MKDENDYIVIKSLSEFISKIGDFKSSKEGSNEELFFRGQSDNRWSLKSSLFRESLVSVESRLIDAAMMLKPSEFSSHSTLIENLAKLQHYGLPTRLLDITMNPLVALYFACNEPIQTDPNQEDSLDASNPNKSCNSIPLGGVVYLKSTYPINYNDFKIKVASHLVAKKTFNNYTIKMLIDDVKRLLNYDYSTKSTNVLKRNIIDILQNNFCIISPTNNERLLRQSGAFIFCTNFLITEDINNFINSVIQKAASSLEDSFFDSKIFIPENCKQGIIAELDCHGVNMLSLFPELDHQMLYLKKKFIKNNSSPVVDFEPIDSNDFYNYTYTMDYQIDDSSHLFDLLVRQTWRSRWGENPQ